MSVWLCREHWPPWEIFTTHHSQASWILVQHPPEDFCQSPSPLCLKECRKLERNSGLHWVFYTGLPEHTVILQWYGAFPPKLFIPFCKHLGSQNSAKIGFGKSCSGWLTFHHKFHSWVAMLGMRDFDHVICTGVTLIPATGDFLQGDPNPPLQVGWNCTERSTKRPERPAQCIC